MTSENETKVAVDILRLKEAHALAPLLASYAQVLKRGAPRP